MDFLPNINEWQKSETIGVVEPSIEKAQTLTDYIMSIHWSTFVLFLIFLKQLLILNGMRLSPRRQALFSQNAQILLQNYII